ncbi:hypothetical protein AGLY_001233 [Aphis glycines]|uniref:Transmembrane protein n=1 Tax=Aphis glycines TaxID=307491 RepID=A0A6G0UA91_APHGL|nr:hypothetical protein AGLY_001233 [Aphis glycines]
MVYIDKKQKIIHIIVKSIHSSLHLESKITTNWCIIKYKFCEYQANAIALNVVQNNVFTEILQILFKVKIQLLNLKNQFMSYYAYKILLLICILLRKADFIVMISVYLIRLINLSIYNEIVTGYSRINDIEKVNQTKEIKYKENNKESCIQFSSFFGHQKFFYRHLKKKILRKIENFCGPCINNIFELQPYKKIPVFRHFFLFFLFFLKTVGKCLLLTTIMHQGYSLCHRKPPPPFFSPLCCTQIQKKKHTHIIVKSIHSSLHSESKILLLIPGKNIR